MKVHKILQPRQLSQVCIVSDNYFSASNLFVSSHGHPSNVNW